MKRYDAVDFEFVCADDTSSIQRGVVIVRDTEMVLEVECPGDRPYLIRGKAHDGYYAGVHEGLPEDVPVSAKWTRLDDIWIGTWLEDGFDYLFTFRITPPRQLNPPATGKAVSSKRK
jgi:hypothetical protein